MSACTKEQCEQSSTSDAYESVPAADIGGIEDPRERIEASGSRWFGGLWFTVEVVDHRVVGGADRSL